MGSEFLIYVDDREWKGKSSWLAFLKGYGFALLICLGLCQYVLGFVDMLDGDDVLDDVYDDILVELLSETLLCGSISSA